MDKERSVVARGAVEAGVALRSGRLRKEDFKREASSDVITNAK